MRIHHLLVLVFTFSFGTALLASETSSTEQIGCETLTYFFQLWRDSGFGQDPNGTERAAWMIRKNDGTHTFQKWRNSGERNKQFWKGAVPENVIAAVHTHPAGRDSKPSPADITFAKNLNVDVYVISSKGLWVSYSDGNISQVMNYTRFKDELKACSEAAQNEGRASSMN